MSNALRVPRLATTVVSFIERRPFLSMALGFLLVGLCAAGLPRLGSDFTHRAFFFDDDPLLVQFDAFQRRFGNDDVVIVAVHSPSGVFDRDSATLLNELTDRMWQVP